MLAVRPDMRETPSGLARTLGASLHTTWDEQEVRCLGSRHRTDNDHRMLRPYSTGCGDGMSIIRAPRPDRGFTILDNDVLRDRRLSFKARGVLAWILSQPDNWRTDADKLSKEGLEGRDAIRSALKELREAGYIVQTRRQDDRGRWVTVTMVYDRPQDVSAGQTEGGKPAVGYPDVGDTAANRSTTKNDYEEDEKSCVDAPRRPGDEDQPKSNWREEDRRLFVEIVGSDWIRVVEGGPWGPGKFKTTALYEAMRKGAGRVEPKKWPGIYLRGLEDWEDYLGGLSVEVA